MKNRRQFFQQTSLLATGLIASPFSLLNSETVLPDPNNIYLIGPQEGYSPQIGTLLSTMTMMRTWIVRQVDGLSTEQLDFQIDEESNSIGAMLLHLAATERYYQLNTFDDMSWGSWSDEIKKEWDIPMNLGKAAREKIKGNDLNYYLTKLEEVRSTTIKEFAKRDDEWLQKSVPFFENKPTNNYCKWFHVCEHESNHNGQIKFIMKRFPA